MENKEENTLNVNVKPYAVLLIDLMGQTDFFSEFDEIRAENLLETNPSDISKDLQGKVNKITETINALAKKQNEMVRLLKGSKEWLKGFFKRYLESINIVLSEDKLNAEVEIIASLEFKSQQFSDTIIWYVSLENAIKTGLLIDFWLGYLSSMMIGLLSEETPIRGAMAIGYGWEINSQGENGNLYGPVLSKVYGMESKDAQYPRILVDDSVIKFKDGSIDYLKKTNLELSNHLHHNNHFLLKQDFDGLYFLDYLSINQASRAEANYYFLSEQDSIIKAFAFIENSVKRYAFEPKTKNKKIALYYHLLENYFLRNLRNWGISAQMGEDKVQLMAVKDPNFSPIRALTNNKMV